jgi:hypothetical protein
MWPYLIASVVSGILFGILDGVINANALALRLYAIYQPIARPSINAVAGLAIDLCYGFIMAGLFLLLYNSLPGSTGALKGLGFGLIAWFFRVLMSGLSSWMMFNITPGALFYSLGAGLVEMLILGLLYGLILRR